MGRDNAQQIRCEKVIIHACNVIFLLIGIILVTIGSIGIADYNVLSVLLKTQIFYYVLAAGLVLILFAVIGSLAANCVLDDKSPMVGKILLIVYWIFVFAFTAAQIVVAISYFVVAGYIESQPTGNTYIDYTNQETLGKVNTEFNRFLNCSFNYCCSGYTHEDKEFVLMNAANFNLRAADGTIDRQAGVGAQADDSGGRSEAATFVLGSDNTGEVNFVDEVHELLWKQPIQDDIPKVTQESSKAAAVDRYIYKKQYYTDFSLYERVINENKLVDPTFDAATTISWASECKYYDPNQGNRCWVRWKTMCPMPYSEFDKAGWDNICKFVSQRETWILPDLDQGNDALRTPMLDSTMCNAPNATGVYGRNGYKAAAVWKIRRSYPVAVIFIVMAVLELMLLIAVCFVVFHRIPGNAAGGKGVDSNGPVDVSVEQHKQPKQSEGENKVADNIDDPDI